MAAVGKKTSVEELRRHLTELQRTLLDEIVAAFMASGEGIVAVSLHLRYIKAQCPKATVIKALNRLGGSVVFESDGHQPSSRYQPTLLGVFLSSGGKQFEDLMARYLDYAQSLALEDPDRVEIKDEDIEKALGISRDDSSKLHRLLAVTRIFGLSSQGKNESMKWQVRTMRDVDDLPSWPSKVDFVHDLALKGYDSKEPVMLSERRSYRGKQTIGARFGLSNMSPVPWDEDDFQNGVDSQPAGKSGTPRSTTSETRKKDRNTVFLSHTNSESELAVGLKEWIETTFPDRVAVFVSSDERDLKPGDRWLSEIDAALSKAAAMIVICSPFSITRPWIHFESGCAWSRRVPVIPICHSGLKKSELEQPLSTFQGLTLEEPDFSKKLLKAIAGHFKPLRVPRVAFDAMDSELRAAASTATSKREGNARHPVEAGTQTSPDLSRLIERATSAEAAATRAIARTEKRSLSAHGKTAFVDSMASFHGQRISVYHDDRDAEAERYASMLSAALKDAGVGSGDYTGIGYDPRPEGVVVYCVDPLSPSPLPAGLLRALRSAGVAADVSQAAGWAAVDNPNWAGLWIGIKRHD